MNFIHENSIVVSSLESEESAPLTCSLCDKKFSNEKRYFGHLRIHSARMTNERFPFSAETFVSRSRPETHENSCRSLARPHECAKCSSVFDRASQLDYHRRSVHMREKSQICQICGKGFFRKNDLQTHLNVHLGTNQSICEICGRKFNHVSNLIRHCRTHAGAKPYPCAICGKRFTQISSLVRHKRIHERESKNENNDEKANNEIIKDSQDPCSSEQKKITKRRHYCRICGETFQFIVLLRKHKRIHAKNHETSNDKVSSSSGDCRNIEEEKISIFNDNIADKRQRDITNNLIDEHLMELAKKMNSIGTENERDLSISDILSPYDSETKFYEISAGGESLEKNYHDARCLNNIDFESSAVSQSSVFESSKTRSIVKTCPKQAKIVKPIFPIEASRLMEIGQSEYADNSNMRSLILEEIANVDEFREECFDDPSREMTNNEERNFRIEAKSMKKNVDTNSRGYETEMAIDVNKEPALRLVKTETGEQFYELIVNNRVDDCENQDYQKSSKDADSRIDETARFSIFVNNCETLEEANFGNVTNVERSGEFLKFSSNIENHDEAKKIPSEGDNNSQMPMVRLVQNEDGEQFFELVREPLEYERNRFNDCSMENSLISHETIGNPDISVRSKEKTAIVTSTGGKSREKKEITTMNNGEKIMKDRARKFQCDECDKWFSTAYNFKQHAGTHFADRQKFHCEHCGLSFAWKSTLNKHLAGNHRPDGPQKFVCEICPKVYGTLSQVNEHVKRDHLKERNHSCTLCGKAFFKKFDLLTHSRIHANDRPYVCHACGKRFHHRSHIIRHERTHTGERPYECNICRRTFSQAGSLKSHRRRHREVKIDILEYRMNEDDPLALAVQ